VRVYRLEARQAVPIDPDAAWDFFSTPVHLADLTPPDLGFRITIAPPAAIYAGLFLHYQVSPLFGVRVRWVTEIAQADPPRRFVDAQRAGPYALWHHEHEFVPIDGGTEVRDLVHYALPFDPLSRPLHDLLVRPRLRDIFRFRREILRDRFGAAPPGAAAPILRIDPI
jgi:ligand-binding SRPBCC domain-containing protein